MAWLGTWAKRRKITVDADQIDSDLTHFPVPIVLGTSVGQSNQDVSDIFDELEYSDVDDDFNTLNHNVWDYPDISAQDLFSHDTSNNRLSFVRDDSGSRDTYTIKSLFRLSGDFDVQVDFGINTLEGGTNNQAALFTILPEGTSGSLITRYYSGSNGYWATTPGTGSTSHLSTHTSGKLRVSRTGTTMYVYYWTGSAWTTIRTDSSASTNDVEVHLSATQDGSAALDSWIDNFTVNSGTIVWPENTNPNRKKIAVTQSDGTTQIFGEIEHWDDANEKAVIWVSRDDLVLDDTVDTDLYIYYDSEQDDNTYYIEEASEVATTTAISGDAFTGTNGDPPDPDLWTPDLDLWGLDWDFDSSDIEIQGDKLRMEQTTTSSTATFGIAVSKFKLSGDFDVQIDIDVADWSGSTGTSKEGTIYLWETEEDRCYLRFDSEDGISTRVSLSNSWDTQVSIARTNNYGKLRYIRTGSSLVSQYQDGAGSWTTLATKTFSTGDVYVVLFQRFVEEGFYTDWDNLVINSGTVKITPSSHVWHQNYRGVYNLAQDPNGDVSSAIKDSSRFGFHGTPVGSMTSADLIDGIIGKALDFDGSNDCVTIPMGDASNVAQQVTDAVTFHAVAYQSDWSTYSGDSRLISCVQTGGFQIDFDPSPDDVNALVYTDGSYKSTGDFSYSSLSSGFHLFSCSFDGTNLKFFIDGVQQGTTVVTSGTIQYNATAPLLIGAEPDASGPVSGYWPEAICHASIVWKAQSDDWISAFWSAISDDILTFGAEENSPSDTALSDMSLDIQTYQDSTQDMSSDMVVATYAVPDIQMSLAAYLQHLSNLKQDMALWQDTVQDMIQDMILADTSLEDKKLELAAYFNTFSDLPLDLKTFQEVIDSDVLQDLIVAVEIREDGKLDFSSVYLSLQDLKNFMVLTQNIIDSNTMLDLSLGDGIILKDNILDIQLSDGNKIEDVGLHLTIVAKVPVYKAVYGLHLASAIKDIT